MNGMVKKSVILMVILMGLVGCTPQIFNKSGMRPTTSVKMHRSNLMPVYDEYDAARYYMAQVDFKDKNLSGILALSKESDAPRRFRMVMMTPFGVPLFDFSLSQDSFIVNSCVEQMNKKIVLNMLERDFKALLMLDVPETFPGVVYMPVKPNGRWGYSVNTRKGGNNYILYERENGLLRVIQNGGALKRMNAAFDSQSAVIDHPKLGFKMTLTLMPKAEE